MDYYTKCIKQVLFSELGHLEIKEKMYKEIYEKVLDEYVLKEKEINDMLAAISHQKYINSNKFKRKIALLIPSIVLGAGVVLFLTCAGLSVLGVDRGISMIVSLVVTICGTIPVFYRNFSKIYNKSEVVDSDYEQEIEKLKSELKRYKEQMERAQTEYLDVSLQVSQLLDEIDELDDMVVSHEVNEDIDIVTVSKKPMVRKLVIEEN